MKVSELANSEEVRAKPSQQWLKQIERYEKKMEAISNSEALQDLITRHFHQLCQWVLELGEDVYVSSSEENTAPSQETYLTHFVFPEPFKDLTFLHKDTLLQLQIAEIRKAEELVDVENVESHYSKCKFTLSEAISAFKQKMDRERDELESSDQKRKKVAAILKHQKNPWPVYKNQFEGIVKQLATIANSKVVLSRASQRLQKLREITLKTITGSTQSIDALLNESSELMRLLQEEKDMAQPIAIIDALVTKNLDATNKQLTFTEELTHEIGHLDSMVVPIRSDEGQLRIREIPLNKVVQKWFDYTILPDLMDLLGHETNAMAKCQISFLNLKNSAHLLKNQSSSEGITPLIQTTKSLITNLEQHREQANVIGDSMTEKVNSHLRISNLFKGESFLEIPLGSTISSSLDLGRNKVVNTFQKWYRHVLSYFDARYKQSEYLESFSEIEMTTKCVAYRMLVEENEHYDTLFLNKNFIGDLFLIPRLHQERKLSEAIEQWNQGFRKAALISGDRLSGRSTFASYASKKYFGKHVVVLNPNATSTIDGRKFTTTNDLAAALEYVKNNNAKSTRPAIVIDDIELWHDSQISLLTNLRALIHFIEDESDDAFVMAVCTTAMQHHLDTRLKFSSVFSTQINTTKTAPNEILEALLLRHGAGHRDLITENGEEISQQRISTICTKMSKKYEYNIGEVLQAWTYNTFVQEGQKVLFVQKEPEFLDFFSKEELLILKQASLFKNISEYGLKQVTAGGFEPHIKSGIKRLINTKIVLRDSKGNLSINPAVLFDVRRILKVKNYIN